MKAPVREAFILEGGFFSWKFSKSMEISEGEVHNCRGLLPNEKPKEVWRLYFITLRWL